MNMFNAIQKANYLEQNVQRQRQNANANAQRQRQNANSNAQKQKTQMKNIRTLYDLFTNDKYKEFTESMKDTPMSFYQGISKLVQIDALKASSEFKNFISSFQSLFIQLSSDYPAIQDLLISEFIMALDHIKRKELGKNAGNNVAKIANGNGNINKRVNNSIKNQENSFTPEMRSFIEYVETIINMSGK